MKTERLNRVLQKLEAQGIPQMIVTDPVSIFYLTGYYSEPGERHFALYINKNGGHKLFVNVGSFLLSSGLVSVFNNAAKGGDHNTCENCNNCNYDYKLYDGKAFFVHFHDKLPLLKLNLKLNF